MAGALGVVITTDVPVSGQHAQPVYVDDTLPIVGPSRAIVVTNGDVPQMGGPPLAVRLAPAGTPATGPALSVYVVPGGGSLGGAVAPSSLLTGIVAYYPCQDLTGADATGRGNTLTAVNSPTNVTGIVGNGLNLVRASNQYMTIADNADLSMGDIDFTLACWYKVTSAGVAASIISKYASGTPQEYWLGTVGTTLGFYVSANGSTSVNINWGTALSAATWYFIVAWHDSVANTINIRVNDSNTATLSHSAGVADSTNPFRLGAMSLPNNQADGVIDEVGIWKRVLTAAEITALYNAGAGRTYPFVGT